MTEFVNIELDTPTQPANVRLSDDTNSVGAVTVTQASFNNAGVLIHWLRSGKKPKEFPLLADEMDKLADAWMDYRGLCIQHAVEKSAREKALIAQAYKLAASVHFDYEPLNIVISQDGYSESGYYPAWHVTVPAVRFNHYYDISSEKLLETVQAALNDLKEKVEHAEHDHWVGEWKAIVASYRRAIPLEPEEIQQARALLKEAGITGWVLNLDKERKEPPEKWILHGSFGANDELAFLVEPPAQILAIVKEYLERKAEQGELAQIGD